MFFLLSPTALKNLFRRPATRLYPKTPYQPVSGTRGHIRIDYDECTFCTLCARRCPSQAIKVDRKAKIWEIDRLRCIICGYCVEVCPKDCLYLEPDYTLPFLGDEKATSRDVHRSAEAVATGGDSAHG